MIQFRCAQCGDTIEVPESLSGLVEDCPECKTPNRVPVADLYDLAPGISDSDKNKTNKSAGQGNGSQILSSGTKKAQSGPRTILAGVLAAVVFPFRGKGIALMIAGAVFFYGLRILGVFSPLLGLLISAFTLAYIVSYAFKVLGESARGEDSPPAWPDLTEILKPLLLYLAAIVVAVGPAFAVHIFTEEAIAPFGTIPWVVLIAGFFVLPMTLMSAALHDSFVGLNPILIFRSIFRVLPSYFILVIAFFSGLFVCWCAARFVAGLILIIGPLTAGAIELYMVMSQMYLVGLLYRLNERKLRWF